MGTLTPKAGIALVFLLLLACPIFYLNLSALPSFSVLTPGTTRVCLSLFDHYEPSTLELEWADHLASLPRPSIVGRSFCEDSISPRFRERLQHWVTVGARQNLHHPTTRAEADAAVAELTSRDDVFSRFVYRDSCTNARSEARVAPLAGLLRDPRGPCTWGCCGTPEAPTGHRVYLSAPLLPPSPVWRPFSIPHPKDSAFTEHTRFH